MNLSKKGEYALRAMIDLSLKYGKGSVHTQDISEKEHIPQKFLEQILLELKKAGLLESKRGRGGGYSLIKSPEAISLAQVIRIVDGRLAPLGCVSDWAHIRCPDESDCGLHKVMREVRNAIVKILEDVSFADVCKKTTGTLKNRWEV